MKVGIIMGGPSSERQVSINTGNEMLKYINNEKYDVYTILFDHKAGLIDQLSHIDFALLALHGTYGEDGTIQGTLDTLGIPYSGSPLLSSALCMDKNKTKKLLRYEGFLTPDWYMLKNKANYHLPDQLTFPLMVKPNSSGSSLGMTLVKDPKKLSKSIDKAFLYDDQVLIEDYITGREITCCLLDGELLPVLEIEPKDEFFNYASKYDDEGAREQVITLPPLLLKKIKNIATTIYDLMDCKAYLRIDMILKGEDVYVLEVNTLPGMTRNSLFPKSALAADITFTELLDKIISYSLK